MKRFLEWIGIKENLDSKNHKPPFFKEGEIWWCHTGENIGVEIHGKGSTFTRPVLIFKKYDKYSFLGLPLSTKIKTGTWYVKILFLQTRQVVVLSQGRVFDYRRLKGKLGQLTNNQIDEIHIHYQRLHQKIGFPP